MLLWDVRIVLNRFCYVFFQAEDGIRDLVRSRGLGDVYKRQGATSRVVAVLAEDFEHAEHARAALRRWHRMHLALSLIHI